MVMKLHYFDGRGIGEPLRWILSYGGIEFEEVRIPYDKFPPTLPSEVKSKCRWRQVPVVELDNGNTLSQSNAVARYLAKKANLIPQDDYDAALSDEYVESIREYIDCFYQAFMRPDSGEKKEQLKEAVKTIRTKYLDVFEPIIKANGGKFLVGKSISWSDVYMAYTMDHFKLLIQVDLTEGYANIKNLTDNVMSQPNIKKWIDNRPNTKY